MDWKKMGFESEEDFERFKNDFGDEWPLLLVIMDPAYYGEVIAKEYNIKRPTFEKIKQYQKIAGEENNAETKQ